MKKIMFLLIGLMLMFSCGPRNSKFWTNGGPEASSGPQESDQPDESVVHGQATVLVSFDSLQLTRWFSMYDIRASGTTTVTYTNSPATTFTIDVSHLAAGGFTGETLSLGTVSISALTDNNLKVCNPGGNTKCTQGIIRVYTTGTVSGFVNTTDGTYGAPVYAGTLNPSISVGLNSANSVQVETYTIPSNKNKLHLSDFPSPTYSVSSDFSNAGVGSYSMVFIVEYALLP